MAANLISAKKFFLFFLIQLLHISKYGSRVQPLHNELVLFPSILLHNSPVYHVFLLLVFVMLERGVAYVLINMSVIC